MKKKRFFQKWSIVSVFVLLVPLSFCWIGPVSAADTTSSVTITGGTLHFEGVPAAANFAPVTLDGLENDIFTELTNFSVIDARGTGEGWSVQVKAENFKLNATEETLPNGSLSLKKPDKMIQDYTGTANNVPEIKNFEWMAIDGTPETPMITATTGNGLGKWTIDWGGTNETFKLHLDPGVVKEGTYTSTITWSLVAPVSL